MTEGLQEELARYFQTCGVDHGVDVAYLFGSVAKGTAGPRSDVDVAVLFAAGLTREDRFDQQLALAVELSSRVNREVDVLDLAACSPVLQHQVLVHGECVFERDPRVRVGFEVAARRTYFDLKRVRDRHTAGMLRAMDRGEYGGRPRRAD